MAQAASIDIDAQYRILREGAGLLPRERGVLVVSGPDAAEYLQAQVTNDVEALEAGEGCYAALLDRKGRMRSDMRVLRLTEDAFQLDTEPTGLEATRRHLGTYRIGRQVEIEDASAERAVLSVIGPETSRAVGLEGLSPEHAHREHDVAGTRCRAVATELGLDLFADASEAETVADALLEAGGEQVGEEAAEIIRVETGRPRFGAEMTEQTIPQEAGINERAISFTKGCYIGQETVARLHYKGKPNRHLRGLRLSALAESGAPLRLGDKEVGTIATACLSPARGPIALALVRREAGPGDVLTVEGRSVTAEVVELPFEG